MDTEEQRSRKVIGLVGSGEMTNVIIGVSWLQLGERLSQEKIDSKLDPCTRFGSAD